MQSGNWHFLLGLSSSDLFTRAKPAGLAPRRESSSELRVDSLAVCRPVEHLLPSAVFGEQTPTWHALCELVIHEAVWYWY